MSKMSEEFKRPVIEPGTKFSTLRESWSILHNNFISEVTGCDCDDVIDAFAKMDLLILGGNEETGTATPAEAIPDIDKIEAENESLKSKIEKIIDLFVRKGRESIDHVAEMYAARLEQSRINAGLLNVKSDFERAIRESRNDE